jgi:hypothetical protein
MRAMIVFIDDGVESSFFGGLRTRDVPVMDIKEPLLYVQLYRPVYTVDLDNLYGGFGYDDLQ